MADSVVPTTPPPDWRPLLGDYYESLGVGSRAVIEAFLNESVRRGVLHIEYREMYDYRIHSCDPDGADAMRLVGVWTQTPLPAEEQR